MGFGERLRKIREEHDIERKQLAERLGVSYWVLSKYETGEREPDFETLKRIANYFGVSIDYLLGETDSVDRKYLEDLPEEARKEIENFIEFVRQKYKGSK